jgi:hypothetical protein
MPSLSDWLARFAASGIVLAAVVCESGCSSEKKFALVQLIVTEVPEGLEQIRFLVRGHPDIATTSFEPKSDLPFKVGYYMDVSGSVVVVACGLGSDLRLLGHGEVSARAMPGKATETLPVKITAGVSSDCVALTDAGQWLDATQDSATGHDSPPTPTVMTTNPVLSAAIATAGDACVRDSELACTANNSRDKLVCKDGVWADQGSCDGNSVCDTRLGEHQGTCRETEPACLGRARAEVCDGTTRKRCDADGLQFESDACRAHAHCEDRTGAVCVCDTGYRDDGLEGCANIDDCAGNPCGSGGTCIDATNGYSCSCEPGYSGSGGTACTNINECAGTNVCTETYDCSDRSPFYSCRGQMVDWSPSYDTSPFTINGDGTVTDKRNTLVWQRTFGCMMGTLNGTPTMGATCTQGEAKTSCDLLGRGWRLPTKAELESIVDDTVANPAIDQSVFPDTPTAPHFWTSSPVSDAVNAFFYVEFDRGYTNYAGWNLAGHVRCVR